MYGVVGLLDEQHHSEVEALWAEFKTRFGIQGISRTPIPHFSFHVAEQYNTDKVADVLREVAAHTPPLTVHTNGLGIFTDEHPVLYIPVIRSPALTALQQQLWDPLSAAATGVASYYHPNEWRAHITLAHGDVDHDLLVQVIRTVSHRPFRWQVHFDTLGLLSGNDEPEDTIMLRVPLQGAASVAPPTD